MTEPAPSQDGLKRGLKARHMQMIAIGGSIGTGLFVASGGTISEAGPGGALVAYALIGMMVLLLMQSLGEMSARLPVAGSFQTYATVFVNRHFGFAIGWNYWFNWAITVAAELVAAGIVMSYWLPDVPGWIWAAIFLVLLTGLNAMSAKAFGEGEYWLAAIKVITVIVFLVCGFAMIFGIIGGTSPGFGNWTEGDAPFVGGWLSIVSVFMIAGFSFQGTELVGVAAGEAENPQRDVPKAIKTIFWRIMLFYIGAIFVIGMLIPYLDPSLLSSEASDIATSPFTLVFERAGIAFAAALMNAVILSAILSAGNSGLYASARMLYSMAKDGKAPKIFGRLNKRGVPVPAMLLTASVGLFGFLTAIIGQGEAYTWLLNVSGLSGFIAWVGIAVSHYQFRKAYVASGQDLADLPYKAPLFPLGPILAFVILLVVIAGQNYQAVIDGNLLQMASSYVGLPIFLLLWLGHWLATRKQPAEAIDPWTAKLN
ncbi:MULTISPECIES: amino acid permease [Glutamicibacter]|uniref:Amino acid permease n=2 Tax=Glutamicibacter halophytocola TaxID=1933880 RepID=A0A5B8I2K2_9MICC|nr:MULTISPECIES: amino acid permease [Glutamicibacter]ALG27602.1 gamma-aminobutyrate permease [Glutamicibacter halophytocola]MBF6673654.1 amino acid permease [Glutamicibacter sp. FBE19]QDY66985.1 amino acid permease [Glutamicibacter halophytocola]UUX59133.1 amino acid permease [Glutamicibacter halophytocola]